MLSFKKHGFEFEKLVELFENIEVLKVQNEEFKNVYSNLIRQKNLRRVEVTCIYPKYDKNKILSLISNSPSAEEGSEGALSPQKFDDVQVTHPIHIYELFNIKFYNSL